MEVSKKPSKPKKSASKQTSGRVQGGKRTSRAKARRAPSPAVPVLQLPPEIVLLILELLDIPDQLALNRASKWFYSIINSEIYAKNVRFGGSTCIFWGAEKGRLGTLRHAFAAGADLNASGPLTRRPKVPAVSDADSDDSDNDNADGDDTNDDDADVVRETRTLDSKLQPYATPLHLAAKSGHRDVVEWLLNHNVDIDAPSFRVCSCHAMKFERNPLRRGADWPKWRPLHTAMCHGERLIAELLIYRGASLDLDDTPGHDHTALHSAAANGLLPVIKLLAIHNTDLDVNQRDRWDNTALHYVAELFRPRDCADIRDTITKLLALGADLEAHNERGHTPLLNACFRGNFAVAHRLASIGANPDPHRHIEKFRDVRPIYFCTLPRADFFNLDNAPVKHDDFEGNRVSLIKALVEAGAAIDARFDKRGHREATALMLACELAEPRAVDKLIECGASPNTQDRSGRTPLYYACSVRVDHRGEVADIAVKLLKKGARMDLEEEPMSSPLEWAVMQLRWTEDRILKEMLKVAGANNVAAHKLKAALKKCASSGNYKALKLLLKFTQRLYGVTDRDVKTYLDLIIEQSDPWNQVETLETTLDFGRSVYTNEMLLLKTIMQKNKALSVAVLNRFVSVSEPTFLGGQTYLHLACQWGELDVVKQLLDRGADIDVFDHALRTPLSIAIIEDHPNVAACLMNEVADPYLVPSDAVLQEIYGDEDPDEWRFVKKRFLTAFDLAIRESRILIIKEILVRYNLPTIPLGGWKTSYLYRACQNPNLTPLKLILERLSDSEAAEQCSMSIIRDVWSEKIKMDVAASALQAAKLLTDLAVVSHSPQFWELMEEIATWEGPDFHRLKIWDMIMKEMRLKIMPCHDKMEGDLTDAILPVVMRKKPLLSMTPDMTDEELLECGIPIPED
ncbi:ankyrin repeat-containing domain protein [Triangularia verruculosa]|uniref:Ankyrin repeat-containing domain protein n=1 Tax=Triangularia verruculosa TaxID=2587418 RepID=A0AAN6XC94_9PEZI|nr:ankyrin repeat-containing domain protein [Triangularia verruculosa]